MASSTRRRSWQIWLRSCLSARVSRPCMVLAAAIRARPSSVRGPVLKPPWPRHLDDPGTAGGLQCLPKRLINAEQPEVRVSFTGMIIQGSRASVHGPRIASPGPSSRLYSGGVPAGIIGSRTCVGSTSVRVFWRWFLVNVITKCNSGRRHTQTGHELPVNFRAVDMPSSLGQMRL